MSTTPIVLESHKLLLFTIEKVGSTVLRQLMRRMMGYADYDFHGGGIPHVFPKNGLRYLHQYTLEEAQHMMVSDEWVRAMFVRDPKERALSGFLMWRPPPVEEARLRSAARGELTDAGAGKKGKPGMLAQCCKTIANNDVNFEVLCLHHVSTFDGFLDMVEDPKTINLTALAEDYRLLSGREKKDTAVRLKFLLRNSPSCPDKHWSPITQWRMERKFYPRLNFIGHLETAQWDIRRLLDKLHPRAWEEYGLSGWGSNRNESMFTSASTVLHAKGTENYLNDFYNEEIERRVEKIYADDYENEFLELDVVKVGEASRHYKERFVEKYLQGKDGHSL
ncbi:hypothetical protein ACHAWX_001430 [Stephanocyclus meneghinianus]